MRVSGEVDWLSMPAMDRERPELTEMGDEGREDGSAKSEGVIQGVMVPSGDLHWRATGA